MQTILQHYFQVKTLREVPAEKLQRFIEDFPFSGLGRLLLVRKLQYDAHPGFEDALLRAALYLNNPLLLQAMLHEDDEAERDESKKGSRAGAEEGPTTINTDADSRTSGTSTPHDLIEDVVLHQETIYGTPEETVQTQEEAFEQAEGIDEKLVPSSPEQPIPPQDSHLKQLSPNGVSEKLAGFRQRRLVADGHELETYGEDEPLPEDADRQNGNEPLTFQAFHTVDYFASQGIKISQEIQQGDKIGKQLKSFTEWLKTMRRLPPAEVQQALEKTSDEQQITRIAAHSLEENEVVTEAMAEVLAKQGKLEKAREVYAKLSLLNPQKSAYFAAKIESINQL